LASVTQDESSGESAASEAESDRPSALEKLRRRRLSSQAPPPDPSAASPVESSLFSATLVPATKGKYGHELLGPAPPEAPHPAAAHSTGFFFRWDGLWASISPPDDVAIGNPDAEGTFISNGIPYPFVNSVSTSFIDDRPEFGNRIEFGFLDSPRGVMASVLWYDQDKSVTAGGGTLQFADPIGMLLGYQDSNDDSFDDDLDGDGIYGRSGEDLGTPDPANPGMFLPTLDGIPDTPAPADTDDLVTWVPVFSSLTGTSQTDITGLEILGTIHQAWPAEDVAVPRTGIYWLYGARYVDIDDRFSAHATGSTLFESVTVASDIENFIIGPEIGVEGYLRRGPWRFGGGLRFLFGINLQRGSQWGSFVENQNPPPGDTNRPLNLNSFATSNIQDNEQFSPVLEWRLDSNYDVGQYFSLRLGYMGMFVGGIQRGPTSVDYTLPNLGLTLGNGDDLTVSALTFGFELHR
jgi:hypothetical protein